MKKLVLLFALLLLAQCAYAENRIIRTYRPIPYSYGTPGCHGCNHGYGWSPYYNNGSYNRYYPRYSNPRYVNSGYHGYRRPTAFNRLFNNGNTYRRNVSPTQRALERFRSGVDDGIVNVSDLKPLKSNDTRLSEIERTIYGKDYPKQDLNLRLNRLEKSMFNQTYPKKNADERIDNLYAGYNNKIKSVPTGVISDLEKCVWGRSYGNETPEMRVSKLEEEVLGAIQQGELNKRVSTLENALAASNPPASYGTCYGGYVPGYDPNIVNDYHDGAFGRFKNNLGLIFGGGGCPTGWSPQLNQNQFGLIDDGDSEGYVGNTGYAYRNTRRGTGTGIQILD